MTGASEVSAEEEMGLWVQGRFSNPNLDPKAAESLFREHLVLLQKRAVDGYIELLEEVRPIPVALFASVWRYFPSCRVPHTL